MKVEFLAIGGPGDGSTITLDDTNEFPNPYVIQELETGICYNYYPVRQGPFLLYYEWLDNSYAGWSGFTLVDPYL